MLIMKKIVFLFAALVGTLSVAQELAITENTWYLDYLIIDGQAEHPSNFSETSTITMSLEGDSFQAGVCYGMSATVDTLNDFFVYDHVYLLFDCIHPESSIYEGKYYGLLNYIDAIPSQLNHEIIENTNGTKTLIVTNLNQVQGIFGDQISF
ncbi:MAG: hypothetical protein ACJA1Z_001574 [Patiriisocius sp.]|jgi:hypothetical protein